MLNQKSTIVWRGLICAVVGILISFFLAQSFFDFNSHALIDKLFLLLVPAGAIFVILMYLFPIMQKSWVGASPSVRWFATIWALMATFALLFFAHFSSLALLSSFIVFLLLLVPAMPSMQIAWETSAHLRVLGAWLFAFVLSFFVIGFLDDFYSTSFEVVLITFLLQVVLGVGGYFYMGRVRRVAQERWFDAFLHAVMALAIIVFIGWLFQAEKRVSLFPASYFVLDGNSRLAFVSASLLALPWQAWMHIKLKLSGFYNNLKTTKFYSFVSTNLAGIATAFAFLVVYLLFASVINDPHYDVDDIFFDADGLNWRTRLTTDLTRDYYWRSVHPFALTLLKPPVDLIAFFLKGNKLWGAYLLVALAGASCVFLVWLFIKTATGKTIYASLIAALLGFSTSHLMLGSLIETYIFLAAFILLFYVLLINDKPLPPLILAGLATIGMTYTNFAQNVIAFFVVRKNVKQLIRFVAVVFVFLVLFTVLNNLLYPDSQPFFFVPSSLLAEEQNLFPLNTLRVEALTRAFFFHNIVAPTPILYDKDIPFIQFRFFKPEINKISRYDLPIQNIASWFWLGLILFAGILFVLNFKKNQYRQFSLALIGCMALNMGLHLRYGKELLLYSPNWTYALILLLGLAWQGVSDRKWFHLILLIFLGVLIANNAVFLLNILNVLASQL